MARFVMAERSPLYQPPPWMQRIAGKAFPRFFRAIEIELQFPFAVARVGQPGLRLERGNERIGSFVGPVSRRGGGGFGDLQSAEFERARFLALRPPESPPSPKVRFSSAMQGCER